jgi:hypothetical protein
MLAIIATCCVGCETSRPVAREASVTLYPAETMADRHFWASVIVFCVKPSALACGKAEVFPRGLGFTVLGDAQDPLINTAYSLVRLDEGDRLIYASGTMKSEAHAWTRERKCAGEPRIGMTEIEAREAWCRPDHVNSTETLGRTREQWVFYRRGYLYFDNGRLVAIQHDSSTP